MLGKKYEELKLQYRKMYYLLGRHPIQSVHNKLLLYKTSSTYGIKFWSYTRESNPKNPWDLRNDKGLKSVSCRFGYDKRCPKTWTAASAYQQFLDNDSPFSLKRVKPFELALTSPIVS